MIGPAYLDFGGALYFDAVTEESAEHTAEVTEHNVEQGAAVADHIRDNNDKITLRVFISNDPVEDVNGWYGGSTQSVELDVPKLDKPIPFTPGALINTVASAISSLLFGDTTYKAQVLTFPEKFNAVKDVVDLLDQIKQLGKVGKVITPWKTYEDVVITRIAPVRRPDTGDAVEVTIDLQRIRFVESKLVTAPAPTETRGKTMKAKGRQPTFEMGDVNDNSAKRSALDVILRGSSARGR